MKKTAQFRFAAPAEQVFAALEGGLARHGFTITAVDRQAGQFWFSTGVSLFSWGTSFHAALAPDGPASAAINVATKSAYPLQFMDFGQTKREIAKIDALVREGLGAPGPSR